MRSYGIIIWDVSELELALSKKSSSYFGNNFPIFLLSGIWNISVFKVPDVLHWVNFLVMKGFSSSFGTFKYLFLRRPQEAIFAGIIKIVTMFIKIIFKDSRKVKRIINYVSKWNLYLYFLIWQNELISGDKILMSAELEEYVTWFIIFLDLL